MEARVNGQIKSNLVKLVDEDGIDLGLFSLSDALALVKARGVDLVEIEPTSKPPLCQVIDYGKYRYRLQQSQKD